MGKLDGKVALITGATGGIGEATAKRFLEEGAHVMLVGRSELKLRETSARLGGGERIGTAVSDAADEAATRAAIESAVNQFGGLDILFANAGTEGNLKSIEALTVEEFQSVLTTNVIGVWLTIKHGAPALKTRGGGSIVVTASIAGAIGFPNMTRPL